MVDFGLRAQRPQIAVVGVFDLELDVDVVLELLGRHGLHPGNLAHIQPHQHDRVADLEAGRAIGVGVIGGLGEEPAFALGGVIDVIDKAKDQQRHRQGHKPAHRPFHAAEARAQLRG